MVNVNVINNLKRIYCIYHNQSFMLNGGIAFSCPSSFIILDDNMDWTICVIIIKFHGNHANINIKSTNMDMKYIIPFKICQYWCMYYIFNLMSQMLLTKIISHHDRSNKCHYHYLYIYISTTFYLMWLLLVDVDIHATTIYKIIHYKCKQ
jgi:hypothetical protein